MTRGGLCARGIVRGEHAARVKRRGNSLVLSEENFESHTFSKNKKQWLR